MKTLHSMPFGDYRENIHKEYGSKEGKTTPRNWFNRPRTLTPSPGEQRGSPSCLLSLHMSFWVTQSLSSKCSRSWISLPYHPPAHTPPRRCLVALGCAGAPEAWLLPRPFLRVEEMACWHRLSAASLWAQIPCVLWLLCSTPGFGQPADPFSTSMSQVP